MYLRGTIVRSIKTNEEYVVLYTTIEDEVSYRVYCENCNSYFYNYELEIVNDKK